MAATLIDLKDALIFYERCERLQARLQAATHPEALRPSGGRHRDAARYVQLVKDDLHPYFFGPAEAETLERLLQDIQRIWEEDKKEEGEEWKE